MRQEWRFAVQSNVQMVADHVFGRNLKKRNVLIFLMYFPDPGRVSSFRFCVNLTGF